MIPAKYSQDKYSQKIIINLFSYFSIFILFIICKLYKKNPAKCDSQ